MRKYIFLLLCIILNSNAVQSQEKLSNRVNDSIVFDVKIHKRIYQIELEEYPFSIDLIENLEGKFEGNINLNLRTNQEDFVGKMAINPKTVKKLIIQFKEMGIEVIYDTPNYKDYITLDSGKTNFKIYSHTIQRDYSFSGIYSNKKIKSYQSKNKKSAIKILTFLDKKLHLKYTYLEMKKKLPKGKYIYFNGYAITTIITK